MKTATEIIDEQGHFWWKDEPIPEGHFAPDENITGRLIVSEDGQIRLELNDLLSTGKHPMEQVFGDAGTNRVPRPIQGILKTSGRHVLLIDAIRNGGNVPSNRFSYESYFCSMCLVGQTEFPRIVTIPNFSKLEIELIGYEDWLWHSTLKVDRTQRTVTVKSKVVSDLVFNTDFGKLTFVQNTDFPDSGRIHLFELKVREFVTLEVKQKTVMNAEQVRAEHSKIQELMILLTDSHYSLAWPTVQINRSKKRYTLYFHRVISSASPPERHYLPTFFPQFKESFGELFSAWSAKREEFGAGFYNYASTRRDVKLYVENRFANLVHGLESFHRTKHGDQLSNPDEQEIKVRILALVKGKDKKWLKGKLKQSSDLTLADRLFATFKSLPFDLEVERLESFCSTCAEVRNDLAHNGGKRTRKKNSDYLLEIKMKSDALTFLYHMTLLREIGVNDQTLKNWLNKSFMSFALKSALVEVNLLPRETLQE